MPRTSTPPRPGKRVGKRVGPAPRVPRAKHRPAPRGGTPAGRKVLAGLAEITEALERGDDSRLTARTVEVAEPGAYPAAAVKATRERIGASQRVFARMLGVSTVLVQSWEQGVRRPSPLARRLLDEMNARPQAWAALARPRGRG